MKEAVEQALARLTTGIYVLTVAHEGREHGMSSSWATQVSGDPPLVLVAIDVRHRTHAIVLACGHFVLNIVGRAGRQLEAYFYSPASRAEENLAPLGRRVGPTGDPVLEDALGWLACGVVQCHRAGDHALFVARITDAAVLKAEDEPLSSAELPYVYVGKVVSRR